MDETQIRTLEEVESFLCVASQVRPILQGGTDDAYASIERTLVRFGYMQLNIKVLNPCLNFHRPCHFPTIETDDKGKRPETNCLI